MTKPVDNNNKDNLTEINASLVKVLDDLLSKDDWQASQVLKVSAKKIQALRDEAQALLDKHTQQSTENKAVIKMLGDKEGFAPCYILLYQAQKATTLDKWHERIMSLKKHHVNLPVYEHEATLKKTLKNKKNRDHYGYVEVLVNTDKINHKAVTQYDIEGNVLLALHGDAIALDHVRWFSDGRTRYAFDVDLGFESLDES